eukprot:TRINITY_DN358_c0_g1_i1.p1 TRINITY_DN358_c0_g1~~TRINITY_DN358_c0_g1_i1.p1  ORF type:complete len:315 (-),score=93.49 TRINITY_DN358_c0_g1_i1:451-1395(-)
MATMTVTKSGTANLADYMEAAARGHKADIPEGYGYKGDVALDAGFFMDERTGCAVHHKPVVLPSGKSGFQGYMMLFAYCGQEGVRALLQGSLPPMMPATQKAPNDFESLAAIAANFGHTKPETATENSRFCFPFRVPAELAVRADAPGGRDIWVIRLDQDTVTPLLQAAAEGNLELVNQCLKGGVSGAVVDHLGTTALMMAAMNGKADVCKALLAHGASINAAEPVGSKTALMFAAQGGHVDAAKLLLDGKADASKADNEGATALMWAALAGKEDMIRLLLPRSQKAAKNKEGLSALDIANKVGHADAIKALQG